jgi:hypothetical protein
MLTKTLPLFLLLACLLPAQESTGPTEKPNVYLQNNRPKNGKEPTTRTVEGVVKDAADNPLGDAVVQLKNTKTSTIVNFSTKGDGRYVFRDLPMDINFELVAKRGDVTTPLKKVSVYDTRHSVILNFQIAAAKP